jgi:hypothetical protein
MRYKGAAMSAEQTLASVWRIRNADSSANTMHYKGALKSAETNNICVGIRMLTPLQHMHCKRWNSAEQTLASVSEDQEC